MLKDWERSVILNINTMVVQVQKSHHLSFVLNRNMDTLEVNLINNENIKEQKKLF